MSEKKLLWMLTGGTFSCPPGEKGLAPESSEEQARRMLKFCDIDNNVSVRVVMNKDSSDITPTDQALLAKEADGAFSGFDGIMITHGTDTMGYTAAVLSAMLETPPAPVVLTGSQLPFFADGSDAPKNLTDSFAVALSGIRAVTAVFGGKIFYGSDIYKADCEGFDAFRSRRGELGFVKDGRAVFYKEPRGGEYHFHPMTCEKVTVLKLCPGFDGEIITFLADKGYKGIVLECYGSGGIPSYVLPYIKMAAARGVKFTAVSECVAGNVSMERYAVGLNAVSAGVSGGGNIGAAEAMAKLMTEINF